MTFLLLSKNLADNEGRGWLAAIALESNPGLGTDTRLSTGLLRLLAVSGFDEFNPTQLAVLSLLANRAKETLITLTGDTRSENPTRPAHHRFHRAQEAITSSLGIQAEAMDSTSMLSPVIANIEATLFEPVLTNNMSLRGGRSSRRHRPGGTVPGSNLPISKNVSVEEEIASVAPRNDIEFIEAQTRAVEVRSALRWIKARIVRDGMKLSEVAVLARDLEPYRPFLEEIAAEFGIPLRIVGGGPLIENPAVAALLNLLSLPVNDWKRRAVLDSWRSPYFDFSELGIDSNSAAALDEISRAGRVVQGLSQWRESFEMWEERRVVADDEEGDSPLPKGEAAEGVGGREGFEC